MRVLIAYGSHLGSTEEIAQRVATVIEAAGAEVTIRPAAAPDPITGFDAVVVGGGTYGGHWHPDAVAFVRRHAEELALKPTWLFSSGPLGAAAGSSVPHDPVEVPELARLVAAQGHTIFSGAYSKAPVEQSELGRLEKFIAKRFIPEGDWRDWPTIEAWTHTIVRELMPGRIGAL